MFPFRNLNIDHVAASAPHGSRPGPKQAARRHLPPPAAAPPSRAGSGRPRSRHSPSARSSSRAPTPRTPGSRAAIAPPRRRDRNATRARSRGCPSGAGDRTGPGPHRSPRRHHEARLPEEADLLQVRVDVRVAFRHGAVSACAMGSDRHSAASLARAQANETYVVVRECRVGGHQRQSLHLRLRHQHAVERVAMVMRQDSRRERVGVA